MATYHSSLYFTCVCSLFPPLYCTKTNLYSNNYYSAWHREILAEYDQNASIGMQWREGGARMGLLSVVLKQLSWLVCRLLYVQTWKSRKQVMWYVMGRKERI